MRFTELNHRSCHALGPSISNRSSTVLALSSDTFEQLNFQALRVRRDLWHKPCAHPGQDNSHPGAGRGERSGVGPRKFTSSLNSLCQTPGQGWEEQPPLAQKSCFGCYTRVSAWHLEEKYWNLNSVLPCSF